MVQLLYRSQFVLEIIKSGHKKILFQLGIEINNFENFKI